MPKASPIQSLPVPPQMPQPMPASPVPSPRADAAPASWGQFPDKSAAAAYGMPAALRAPPAVPEHSQKQDQSLKYPHHDSCENPPPQKTQENTWTEIPPHIPPFPTCPARIAVPPFLPDIEISFLLWS